MSQVNFVKANDIRSNIEKVFVVERKKLLRLFPHADIQHVGGTAVAGLLTKWDLDINIRTNADRFPLVVERLKGLYGINQLDNWTSTYASFKDDARNIGIQVTVIDSKDDFFVRQRDYLNHHPEAVTAYNQLKTRFEGEDMDEYRKEKSSFWESRTI